MYISILTNIHTIKRGEVSALIESNIICLVI